MPVEPGVPFLSAADIANLHDIVGQGLQTVQDFQDPEVLITFLRRGNGPGRTAVLTDVKPISIKLQNQQEGITPVVAETTIRGIAKFWIQDFATEEPQPEDRFVWLEHVCRVIAVHPPRLGSVVVDFELLEGN